MKQLNSKTTYIAKWVIPLIWYGVLTVFICIGLFADLSGNGPGIIFVVGPLVMMVQGYFFMKRLVWNLIDEVYDEGSTLLLRKNGKYLRINLKDIKNVSYTTMSNRPRVILSIRYQTEFGDELSFSPPYSWIFPYKKNKDIELLIDRIDEARR